MQKQLGCGDWELAKMRGFDEKACPFSIPLSLSDLPLSRMLQRVFKFFEPTSRVLQPILQVCQVLLPGHVLNLKQEKALLGGIATVVPIVSYVCLIAVLHTSLEATSSAPRLLDSSV